jgi:MinD-like ATPase involved in chromosome partitioning or flagellar assembly
MTGIGLPLPGAIPVDAGVALASAGAAWEPHLVPLIARHRSGLHLVRRCVDLADLVAVCRAGLVSVAVVSAGLARLDGEEVARLRSAGVSVLVIEDEAQAGTALSWGVADVATASTPPATLVDRVVALAGTAGSGGAPRPAPDPVVPQVDTGSGGTRGTLVAVWGPTGAPGRSTVAVNLAVEAAQRGVGTIVVDADPAGGAISTLLGILDEAPGLAAACRRAARGHLGAAGLAAYAVGLDDGLRVLTGATRPDRWRELRPAALGAVWDAACSSADLVVVDLGAVLAGGYAEGNAGSSGVVAASALEAADVVVVVGAADPLGLLRLVHAIDQLAEHLPGREPVVVVNRLRESVVGARPGQQVRDALSQFAGISTVHLLPDDPGAADRALRLGRPLAVAAASSPLRAAIADLAVRLVPNEREPAAPPARRRLRRSVPSLR